MNWETIRVLYGNELRMMLRDRRTMVVAVVLPLLLWPVMFYAIKRTGADREKKLAATVYQYAVTGSQAGQVRRRIARGAELQAENARSAAGREGPAAEFRFQEVTVADPAASLRSDQIHFYLEGLSGPEADAFAAASRASPGGAAPRKSQATALPDPAPARLPGVPMIVIYFQGDRDISQGGSSKMRDLLIRERSRERNTLLLQHGMETPPDQVMLEEKTDVASAGQVTGSYLGRFLTLYLMIFLLTGGSIVALDSVAGEKERGSLETLLTTAARRSEIVAAKQLVIVTVAVLITVIQIGNILAYVTFRVIELPPTWVIDAPPRAIAALLLLFLPMSAFTASILLMLSAYAKSYKEAQLYFFPVYLLSWVPALAAVLPGVSLRSVIVLVPVANVSVAVREIMIGRFDWPMIACVFAAMSLAAAWTARLSAKMLTKESLITASDTDAADLAGGAALFPRRVLRWYALMGVVLFAVALNIPALATFRAQLLFNELGLFLAMPLLMIWRYRLNFREALALRPVKPLVWLGVLLAIPSGHLTAVGIFQLANLVFPVPEKMLEQFARELMPDNIPLWQMFLFLSLLPGVCEEIAFRGTLLFGLRRRLRPVALAVCVGLIFGFFHVTLFRIVPTAFLGFTLTGMALLTGSIFPGIVAHAGNNALGLWLATAEVSTGGLWWPYYLAGAAVFAFAFFIIWRARTPYPGLRP